MPNQTSYAQFQPAGYPGMSADMREWDGGTKIAQGSIPFGAPVQRAGDKGCAPLTTGEYIGLAKAMHIVTGNGDAYIQGDNVPVVDEGNWFGLADAAITAGAPLSWNTATNRWTTAAASATVIAVPQSEAETSAASADGLFIVRLRRIPS